MKQCKPDNLGTDSHVRTVPDRFDWLQRWGDLIMNPPTLRPPLQPTSVSDAQAFYRLAYNKEDSDCGVRALAVACAAPYEKSHAAFKQVGRLNGGAVCVPMMLHAANYLGYYLENWPLPMGATLRSCGRHLANSDGGYVLVTCDHAVGMWNGEIIDWMRNTKSSVLKLFKARRIEKC